ncbi:ParA family protein [Novosphingobium umbonatum]|uniref:ParA family protein n=1 Tax=Novosphingobium umbonatum TaxID=1908524 RepID=A0A437N1Z4_9SPHN|nr:ParA family protein [Novosphingobium umbonatum]RVU03944.1 ParA family protein [Novosphingobium umbonatum]
MKVIAVLSQKGGVGKTTLATCLAVAAQADGKQAAIIDLDPQATAAAWADTRLEASGIAEPVVQSIQYVRLSPTLKAAAANGADWVIIDGAAVARDVAHAAASVADLILIPTRAALFDTISMAHTLDLARQLDKQAAVVLTHVAPRGAEAEEARQGVADLGGQMCPVTIGLRKAFSRAQTEGLTAQEFEPNGAAAREVAALYAYVDQVLGGMGHG